MDVDEIEIAKASSKASPAEGHAYSCLLRTVSSAHGMSCLRQARARGLKTRGTQGFEACETGV